MVSATTWEVDGKHYARFVATVSDSGDANVKAEVERINALCARRTFLVPSFKANSMTRTIDDLLEAKSSS